MLINVRNDMAAAELIKAELESIKRDSNPETKLAEDEIHMQAIVNNVNVVANVIKTYPTIISKHLSGRGVYLSGPITGIEDRNEKTFNAIAFLLRVFGASDVFNPVNRINKGASYEDAMTACLQQLTKADWTINDRHEYSILVSLPGWTKSKGATIERFCARACDIKVYDFFELLDLLKEDVENVEKLSELLWGDDKSES
ncbi:DUF4406 domain-containing protein [Lancefieldella rimae]|uniref:DUF4406 domain-containing protein n=1 Tax=Lancefieldella rimae TaxID=1383 RepID=UPI0028E8C6BF|nr:DUF4406 domain-containing protein [Lancefieldella rimae]